VFARLGPWCHDRRWLVLIAWVVILFVGNGVAGGVGDNYRQTLNLPDVESRDGFDLLNASFEGQGTGFTGTIVFQADQGVDDPEVQAAMTELFDAVAEQDAVEVRVQSPYDEGSEQQISEDGTIAYANVEFPGDEDADFTKVDDVKDVIEEHQPDLDGVDVELGGFVFAEFEDPTSEALGIAFAIVILIAAFGSVLAMGLPIGVALFGIGLGGAVTMLLSHVLTIPEFAPFIGVMIGLGVGIDYALLIITRYREQLHGGHDVRESIGIALDTAGRSVAFAGVTVVISLLGMLLIGVPFVAGLAVSASVTVALTVLASLTLLPALIGLAGLRIEKTRRRGLVAAGLIAIGLVGFGLDIPALSVGFLLAVVVLAVGKWIPFLNAEVQHRPPKPRRETLAYRWSRVIQHRPWTAALVGTAILLVLAAPVLGLRLGSSDESNYAEDTTTKQAYDLLVEGFGKGFNGPLLLVADTSGGVDQGALAAVTEAVQADEGVAAVSPPIPNEDQTAVLWNVVPTSGPQEEATDELVDRLRTDLLPVQEQALGTDVFVTGQTAVNVDFASFLGERILWFFAAVLIMSFLFLMVVFRSLLVPLKAVIMNLLSIGAAYGVMVALFQWAWGGDITNVSPAPVEPWMPMMLFAIVFGLSMDYEVFLLSRVREEWKRTGDSRTSVADGLAATAKVITAAAAIMVVVFGSFLLENDRTFKLMGTGLATAIFLDATIVRMLLVPATMELLGDRNWWLPKWLDRILPNVDVEGHSLEIATPLDDEDDQGDEDDEREPALTH
jgi:RND superfamily putative drug exporter